MQCSLPINSKKASRQSSFFHVSLMRYTVLMMMTQKHHHMARSIDIDSYIRDELGLDLESMSERELEQVCEDRGYEMVKDEIDEDTGKLLISSHDDYVDAAKQCLSIQWFTDSELANSRAMEDELRIKLEDTMRENQRLQQELAAVIENRDGGILAARRKKLMKQVAATWDSFVRILPEPLQELSQKGVMLIRLKETLQLVQQMTIRYGNAIVGNMFLPITNQNHSNTTVSEL